MYCPNCGRDLPEDSRFCPNCGREQGRAPSSEPPPGTYTLRGVQIFFGGCCVLPVVLFLLLVGVPLLAGGAGAGAGQLTKMLLDEPFAILIPVGAFGGFVGLILLIVWLIDRRSS